MKLEEYQDAFKTANVSRDDDGILLVRLHSRGESMRWSFLPHRELAELFAAIATDEENRVVVVTGTGSEFITAPENASEFLARGELPIRDWDRLIREGNRLVASLLDIGVPTIAAVNGPATVHSEIAVLCDVVLCAQGAYFQDAGHFSSGLVPGDGMHVVWPLLLGPNRGRSFLLTGAKLSAQAALDAGVVAEVVPRERLLPRTYELARPMAGRNPAVLRNTRTILVRHLRRAMEADLQVGLALEAMASLLGRPE
jgi:enoyl-CoA hydratase/carnithine racemase